jgi:alpha-ketoglutarate-dependent taurine dioxygenase
MGAVAWAMRQRAVSHPRSSNRTCPIKASLRLVIVRHTGSRPTARAHGYTFGRAHLSCDQCAGGRDDRGKLFPKASHPIIRTHPVTKRKALFVNQGFTTHIDGLPQEESRAILNYLFEHCTRPEFQVRFRWRPHSVAFWDNRSVQHMALWDYYPQARSGPP